MCGCWNGQHTVKLSEVRQGSFSDEKDKDPKLYLLKTLATGWGEMAKRDAGLPSIWLRYFVAILGILQPETC